MAWKSFLSIKLYIQNDINSVKIIYMYIYLYVYLYVYVYLNVYVSICIYMCMAGKRL